MADKTPDRSRFQSRSGQAKPTQGTTSRTGGVSVGRLKRAGFRMRGKAPRGPGWIKGKKLGTWLACENRASQVVEDMGGDSGAGQQREVPRGGSACRTDCGLTTAAHWSWRWVLDNGPRWRAT